MIEGVALHSPAIPSAPVPCGFDELRCMSELDSQLWQTEKLEAGQQGVGLLPKLMLP